MKAKKKRRVKGVASPAVAMRRTPGSGRPAAGRLINPREPKRLQPTAARSRCKPRPCFAQGWNSRFGRTRARRPTPFFPAASTVEENDPSGAVRAGTGHTPAGAHHLGDDLHGALPAVAQHRLHRAGVALQLLPPPSGLVAPIGRARGKRRESTRGREASPPLWHRPKWVSARFLGTRRNQGGNGKKRCRHPADQGRRKRCHDRRFPTSRWSST